MRWAVGLALGGIGAVVALLIYVTTLQLGISEQQAVAENRRTQTFKLAERMRQSSNELTMMVRLYVATGDVRYREYFNEILAIRNGQSARPRDYDGSFWDRRLADPDVVVDYGAAKSLVDMMQEARFADSEFTTLNTSREESDRLAEIETEVMQALEAIGEPPGTAAYYQAVYPLYQRLTGPEYFDYKHRIMASVESFIGLVNARTGAEVAALARQSRSLLQYQVFLVMLLVLVCTGLLVMAERSIVRPLRRLTDGANRIASGAYHHRVRIDSVRELEHLGADFNCMADAIQSDILLRKQAEGRARQAQDAAEQADQAKSDFLANMSHEIRTPMNAVMGMAHLALQTDLNDRQRNYLKKIESGAQSLLRIINDILDFSKIEAGRMDLESVRFSLHEVMQNVADIAATRTANAEIEVLFDLPPTLPTEMMGDPLRLGQVLINLVGNAIKFTTQGEVIVRVEVMERNDTHVELQFSIRDTGAGMTPEQVARLFQAFTQADASTTRRFGGTGLGLTISQRLVGMMGGTIKVSSEFGVGSTFSFVLAFPTGADVRSLAERAGDHLLGLRCLVVDDNPAARDILSATLEGFGLSVVCSASGEEAVEEVQPRRFDLVLMDWRMPGMNGIEAAAEIRRRCGHDLQMILVTAYGREEVLAQVDSERFDGYLIKPVSASTLLDTLVELRNPKNKDGVVVVPAETSRPLAGARLLLAEDNPVNREIAVEMLESAGAQVDVAVTGRQAVDQAMTQTYGAVLMDMQMPEMDGLEATRTIRRQSGPSRNIPIIAMTANAMAADRQRCLDAGMNDHIAKPVNARSLIATVVRWVGEGDDATASPEAGIDAQLALQRAGGNPVLRDRMLHVFIDHHRDDPERLRTALAEEDWETLRQLGHALKGSAGTIGFPALETCAGRLESLARDENDLRAAAAPVDDIERALSHLLAAQTAAESVMPGAGKPVTAAGKDVAPILRDLRTALAEGDTRARASLEQLEQMLDDPPPVLSTIRALMTAYAFEEASREIDTLAAALGVEV